MQNEKERLKYLAQSMYLEGLKDEDVVMKLTEEKFGYTTQKASSFEDRKKHIDFFCIDEQGKRYGIDVKGVRKSKRSDTKKDDSINWIEIQNVNGNKGWIYGESVYIAFMTNTSVLYVPTKSLVNLAEEKIRGKELVHENPSEFYVPYQRKNRNDIIIKVPTSDLRGIAKHEVLF